MVELGCSASIDRLGFAMSKFSSFSKTVPILTMPTNLHHVSLLSLLELTCQ